MGRIKKPFTVYPRKPESKLRDGKRAKKQKTVFYYQTYNELGIRTVGRSTGKTSKKEAEEYCNLLFKESKLTGEKVPTLETWVEEKKWYVWETDIPECEYSKGRLKRSSKESPAVGQGYIQRNRTYLETYILPIFGKLPLNKIKPAILEDWLFDLADGVASPQQKQPLAPKTVNNVASAFRIIMKEAKRLSIIDTDPWKSVEPYSADSKKRSSLSPKDALNLMHPRNIQKYWKGHMLYYLVNLTGMLTSLREGEILALRKENLFPDHFFVDASYSLQYHKRGKTKTKRIAAVAIPSYLYNEIIKFAEWDGYIFSFNAGRTPASCNKVLDALYDAMGKIGISKESAQEKGLCFHSWRRFNNTYLRTKNVPDVKIRAQTGHVTEEMTDHYTDFRIEDFKEVAEAQTSLIQDMLAIEQPKEPESSAIPQNLA